jgi:uncharacterized protein with von Willebrand factor type A (vWA) domain
MKTLKERLAEQEKRYEGANKSIGTGGKSPFGAYGYHLEGIRVDQNGNLNKREFRNFDQDR